jgi:hypothetical protein
MTSQKAALRAELNRLRTSLKNGPTTDRPDPAAGPPDWLEDIEKLGAELHAKLSEVAEDVEVNLIAHPLVAVGVALLLGIAIGRMMGRGK